MNINTLSRKRALQGVLLLIVVIFLFLRFVNLDADFPSGITGSGVLYTDEGWYANAAVRDYVSGNWYLTGDFNPAITMPLGQILHRFTFSIFGLSLLSVRLTTAVFFVLLVGATAWWVHQSFGSFAALLTALLLVTNYSGFAFSRIAIMEPIATFFVVSGLIAAGNLKKEDGRLTRLLFASILIAAGILTKNTMVFAVPLLGYLAWRHGKNRQERQKFLFASAIVILCVIGGHQLIAKVFFPEDSAYFAQLNLVSRMHKTLDLWWYCIPRVITRARAVGMNFLEATALTTAIALVVSKQFRKNPMVHLLIGFIVFYFALLSLVTYGPPRYYIPLIVPFAALFATSCLELRQWLSKRWVNFSILPILPLIVVIGVSFGGSAKIISYLSDPSYSFLKMAQEVGTIIEEREGKVSGVVLFGHIANSVATEIGTFSVNTKLGTRTLDWKLKKYHPQYLLLHTDEDALKAVKSEGGHVVELASWDVYNNYYEKGQKVKLMYIRWDKESGPAVRVNPQQPS